MGKVELTKIENKGISVNYEIMENGEYRYRMTKDDGSGYIRTEAGKDSGWQNSHYHKSALETYIVQKDWMAIALLNQNKLDIKILKEKDIYTVTPNIVHNCYLPMEAETHTIKHGHVEQDDWYESKELDKLTKGLREQDVLSFMESDL